VVAPALATISPTLHLGVPNRAGIQNKKLLHMNHQPQKSMKIYANYDPEQDCLQITYGIEEQKVFLKASRLIRSFFNEKLYTALLRQDHYDREDDLVLGSKLLKRLGTSRRRYVRTTLIEAGLALNLVSWSAIHLLGAKAPIGPIAPAVLLLAKITPCSLPVAPLPPTIEVFDHARVPSKVLTMYETLRSWKEPQMPHFFVDEIYGLWEELRRISKPSRDLQKLINDLDVSMILFKWVVEALPNATVIGRNRNRVK
jgi:hypothetical protein